ncbi:MAG: hypothetical protein LLG01_08325 [Planctomycetaceae bacterium]|nr:hypothetical protein [Planctomycetaceae bacterium]
MRQHWMHILIAVGATLAAAGAGTWLYIWYYHPPLGPLPKVEVAAPAGFEMNVGHFVDFDLYTLSRAPGQGRRSSLVIFIGDHPQTLRPSTGGSEKRDDVCGRSATWYAWQKMGPERSLWQEAHLSLPGHLGGHRIHAILSADDPSEMELLENVARTARLLPM